MSFRAPALRRKRSTKLPQTIAGVVPLADVRKVRREWRAIQPSLTGPEMHTPDGVFVQISGTAGSVLQPRDDDEDITPTIFKPQAPTSPTKHVNKKTIQWKRWTETIIPSLLAPYLTLLRESSSLRHLKRDAACDCGAKKMDIVGVYFERKSHI